MKKKFACNAAEVSEFGAGESGHVSAQTESDQVEVAVVGAEHVVEGADHERHLAADESRVDGSARVIRQRGAVLPVDAHHVRLGLDDQLEIVNNDCEEVIAIGNFRRKREINAKLTTRMRASRISLAQTRVHDEPKPWIITLVGSEALNGAPATDVALLYVIKCGTSRSRFRVDAVEYSRNLVAISSGGDGSMSR